MSRVVLKKKAVEGSRSGIVEGSGIVEESGSVTTEGSGGTIDSETHHKPTETQLDIQSHLQ